jgi:hypothetical protein
MFAQVTRLAVASLAILAIGMGTAWGAPPPGKGKNKNDPPALGPRDRHPMPIPLGVSGGSVTDLANGYCCSGTLGSLVEDGNGVQYILSNTHVLAGDSVAGGNAKAAQIGDAINQPGYIDVSCQNISADYVANLSDWAVLAPGGVGTVDAAIAEVLPGAVDPAGDILNIGGVSSDTLAPAVGQSVKKNGRTSGLTTGTISVIDATVNVGYDDECAGTSFVTTFTDQIIIGTPGFLQGGDSGSLMLENSSSNPRAIGLLFAGSSSVGVANPIGDVLSHFGVSMVGTPWDGGTVDPPDDGGGRPGRGNGRNNRNGQERASDARSQHADKLMKVPGSVGHGVGMSKGRNKQAVVVILVEEITEDAKKAKPKDVDGVPVELLEVGIIEAL